MKLKDYNALVNKLAKKNPEQDVIFAQAGPFGPQWLEPAIVEGTDASYIIPQDAIEDNLSGACNRADVGKCLTEFHQEMVEAGTQGQQQN